MSKPDKPETPAHEKMQAKLANKMFSAGADIKTENREGMLAEYKRDNASLGTSVKNAASAKAGKQQLLRQRKKAGGKVATSQRAEQTVNMTANSEAGGVKKSQRAISAGVSGTARMASDMSRYGNQDSLRKFVKSNQRKQALMDAGTAIALHTMYNAEDKPDKEWKEGEVGVNLDASYDPDVNAYGADNLNATLTQEMYT